MSMPLSGRLGARPRTVLPIGWPQLAGLLGALLVSVALGYVTYLRFTAERPVEIQAMPVSRGTVQSTVSATGSVVTDTSTKLSFAASGRVAEVLVKVGDQVAAGQPLARLDTTELDNALRQAQAGQAQAEAKLQTILKGARPEDVAVAQSQLAQAEAKLHDLTAPR